MTDDLPNYKFPETVMQIIWTYVVMQDVVEGVSMISGVPDWWLRPGKRKFTGNISGSIGIMGRQCGVMCLKEAQRDQRLV